ncbi:hypothetical protein FACS189450_11950 [Spirochaetia bacterium]|nr:hypothetical protein FACS189450_11950 [Spirochaetia bacterium]
MKKFSFAALFIAALFFSACPADTDDTDNKEGTAPVVQTGKVTFFNESSYKVVVHRDAFSGPVLLELNAGQSQKVDVRTSDNHGAGTTFSIEYLYRINDGFDTESGEVIASGIDPNVQINFVVEANKSYTKQIPQPRNLEFQSAFIKILNTSSLQFELRYLGTAFKQTGNGNLSVAPGKTGVYKLEGIPSVGKLYSGYQTISTFESTTIPDFTAMNGFIYNFTYNGSSVTQTGSQAITFR